IAPTILYVAGIPLSRDFSGRPIFEALAPAFLRRTPLFLVDSYQKPQAPRAPAPIRWSGDEEMVARLRSLGYLGSSPNDAAGETSGPGGVGPTFHANLAYSRMSSGDLAGAIAEVERALALQPDYLPALVIKAQALDQTGDHPGALRVARTILAEGTRQGQRQPGTFLMVARLHQTLGSVADGIEELSGWARTVGEDPELLIAIGELLLEEGDPLAAEKHFRRALAADPAGEEGLRKVFLLLLGQARLAEAERLLAGPGSRFAGSILFHNLQGLLSQERSDYSAAEREFQAARAIDPEDVPTLSNLGALFGRTGRLQEAAQVLRRAVELEPEHPEALVNLAGALGRLGQLDEVIYRLEGARTAGVDSTAIRNALGLAYYQTRDWNRAERLFRESLADDPDQPEISKILARLPDDRGRSAGETRP
ncbi:MAG: tetratricopeptide repeat protein, partial [Acidobacteriota bacterium]